MNPQSLQLLKRQPLPLLCLQPLSLIRHRLLRPVEAVLNGAIGQHGVNAQQIAVGAANENVFELVMEVTENAGAYLLWHF